MAKKLLKASADKPLDKATYAELFFDLVFVFCVRTILPIITDAGSNPDWYTYYTFTFTFVLMLQIWFGSTLLMNRFGTGGVLDIVFLFTNMFLLFVMTQAISTSWTHYMVYNVCWILVLANTAVHWLIRYKRIDDPDQQVKTDIRWVVSVLAVQVTLILASNLFSHVPAQVVCLIALLAGFSFWFAGGRAHLGTEGCEHLSERCSLLMILMFGEMLIGFGDIVSAGSWMFFPVMYFLLIVGMFLIYLNEIVNMLDLTRLRGGRRYMALSAWMAFCAANVTAAFEMAADGKSLMGMGADLYFGVSVAVFLICFLFYIPFNKTHYPSNTWITARCLLCLLVMAQTSVVVMAVNGSLPGVLGDYAGQAMMVIAVAAVYAVLMIDRIALHRGNRKAAVRVGEVSEEVLEAEVPDD